MPISRPFQAVSCQQGAAVGYPRDESKATLSTGGGPELTPSTGDSDRSCDRALGSEKGPNKPKPSGHSAAPPATPGSFLYLSPSQATVKLPLKSRAIPGVVRFKAPPLGV